MYRHVNAYKRIREDACKWFNYLIRFSTAALIQIRVNVSSASAVKTVLIGDDTDLLIVLLYHASLDSFESFLKPEPKKSVKTSQVQNTHAEKKTVRSRYLQSHFILTCYPWM